LRRSSRFLPHNGAADTSYDIFVDLTDTHLHGVPLLEHVERLASNAGLAGVGGQITLALPSNAEPPRLPLVPYVVAHANHSALDVLGWAISGAVAMHRHLVVLLGEIIPSSEVLALVLEALEGDPMFGTAQPRFADGVTDELWPLPGPDGPRAPWADRATLPFLQASTVTPELLSACMVLRWNVLVAADTLDRGYSAAPGSLLQLLCEMRRRGFRNVVVNQGVLPTRQAYDAIYPALAASDRDRLTEKYPDHVLAETELGGLRQRDLEPLLSATHRTQARRRMVLDCRGMGPQHNGTAQCVLGYLDGFASLECDWEIDVLVSPIAAEFHHLGQRYAGRWRIVEEVTDAYCAAVRLSQPWSLSTVSELHRRALFIAFVMLDTISWDVLYPNHGSERLVWQFVARHADALFYSTHYARALFRRRFPVQAEVVEQVTGHSLRRSEHLDPSVLGIQVSDHILVIGNDYDHKDLGRTVRVLSDAFPFNKIVAFGASEASSANVVAIPAGNMERWAVHQLIASARVVVFPSYYEGFGLPVVEGLSYGRPVVARHSELWAEIAAGSNLPGVLLEFEDAASLVEKVGRALAGLPAHTPKRVNGLDDAPPASWQDCAGQVIEVLNRSVSVADGRRWCERDEALGVASF
jgi:hypothetical protein